MWRDREKQVGGGEMNEVHCVKHNISPRMQIYNKAKRAAENILGENY